MLNFSLKMKLIDYIRLPNHRPMRGIGPGGSKSKQANGLIPEWYWRWKILVLIYYLLGFSISWIQSFPDIWWRSYYERHCIQCIRNMSRYFIKCAKFVPIRGIGLIRLRIGIIGELFWMRHWTSGFRKSWTKSSRAIIKNSLRPHMNETCT